MLKRKPYRNKEITKAARDEECTANFTGCNYNPEKTVFCHLNAEWAGKGWGQKADDCAGFIGCSNCHDTYDGRNNNEYEEWELLRAYYRTIRRLIDKGVLK